MNILISDDNKIIREITREILERKLPDVKVFEAEDGEESIELLKQNDFEYILLDIDMPRLNGFMVLEYITESNIDTEVFIITGSDDASYLEKSMSMGASHFISKPVNYERLICLLKGWGNSFFFYKNGGSGTVPNETF